MPDMLTFIFISVLAIVLFGTGFYFWGRSARQSLDERALPPPPDFTGLFEKPASSGRQRNKTAAANPNDSTARQQLLALAAQRDKAALDDARAHSDPHLYDDVLNVMVDGAETEPALMDLVTYVMGRDGLRVNARLARRMQELWEANPTRGGTSRMLHITARANDAKLLDQAIELALRFWRRQQIPEMSATELLSLFNGEFWTLSADERSSGAGFVLKRTLVKCRRELQTATD